MISVWFVYRVKKLCFILFEIVRGQGVCNLILRTLWARLFQESLVFDWEDFNLSTSLDGQTVVDWQMIFRMVIRFGWQVQNKVSHDSTYCRVDTLVMQ